MKKFLPALILLLTPFINKVYSQATKSYPFAVGTTSCGSGSDQIQFYNYNGTTNVISSITDQTSTNPVARYVPQLRIGTIGATNKNKYIPSQWFTSNYSSISYNPKDHNIYFVWTATTSNGTWNSSFPGSSPRSFIWRWPLGTKPTDANNKLDTLCSVGADLLGVVFDNNGNSYAIEFTINSDGKTYSGFIRSLDLTTRTLGPQSPLNFTGGAKIYQEGSGDVVMTPSGQLFFIVDNKLFTPDYKSYNGAGNPITCTYIDTVINSATGYYVGLTYADGEMVSAYSGGGCPFFETDMLTAATSNVSKSGTVYSAVDMASVISGIGAAKKLVSVTPTGTPGQYDVVYDVYIQNYGNMDITNVQVTDDLTKINGATNVTQTGAAFTDNPAGLTLNSAYDGKTNINLLDGAGTLPNYPVANNHATIRITCRLSNLLPGVLYNNSAIASAVDFNNNNLKDSSTNGSKPDLNGNDKPDDPGEGQPTPLLIAVTPTIAPCTILGQVIYSQNFGSGTGLNTTLPIASTGGTIAPTTQYTATTTAPVPVENYTISNNATNGDASKWINLTDHTGGANGRMMLVNADAQNNVIYHDEVPSSCANQQYSFFFYGAFIGNSSYQTICNGFGGFKYPNVTLRVRDKATGVIIAQATTGDITSTSWQQYGMKFTMPGGFTSVVLELVNNGEGGCGNDLALDDIQFGICNPSPVVNIGATAAGCLGSEALFNSTISDPTALGGTPSYLWQISSDNVTFTNITGATNGTYSIPNTTAGDISKYYRVIVAGPGNMGVSGCQYVSPGIILPAKSQSVAPTGAKASISSVCPGKQITLTVQGGSLGSGASWNWYSGSCGGTLVGTGASITVAPTSNTTYFVRAEGDCNITTCAQVTVTISCDIDKDKDGIPDWVESNIPASFGDDDGDGIINAYDTDYIYTINGNSYPYVDNNGDFINDWFQADGDVDGDGIPNYLDTDFPGRIDSNGDGVDDRFDSDLDGIINMLDLDSDNDGIPDVAEAGGVDENGDGKLDNYLDTDGDGLSDQVDSNLSGAYNSGAGLGPKDTDGDGVPNEFDLDSDNDGIPDVLEVGGTDANNDGMIDGFIDTNHDGISDNITGTNGLLRTGPDTNNDGRTDSYPYKNMDKDGVPNPYDLDSDGDGITDVLEANLPDTNLDGRVDGPYNSKGWAVSVASKSTFTPPNSDGDPNPDYLDIDSDNDGIPDIIEGPSTKDFKFPLGKDSDGDGIDDAFDAKPNQWGGSGIFPIDTDGDNIPDFRDLDTDGDGVPDIKEGHDYNFDGIYNENTTLLGTDTDGDGLDDRFDLDNTSAKGTSSNLGNGGTTNGDPNPGTRAVVQQTPPTAGNRDWRWLPYVLPVNVLSFQEQTTEVTAVLTWEVISSENISSFEIQRSTDNFHFQKIGEVDVNVQANEQRKFTYNNDISEITSGIIFYRLQIRGEYGKGMMSNVIRVNVTNPEENVSIKPNPASHRAIIELPVTTDGIAQVKVTDNTGRMVTSLSQKILKGMNQIALDNLQHLPNGVYTVQIQSNSGVYNLRLVITR
mgnify:CR=1 FL=1